MPRRLPPVAGFLGRAPLPATALGVSAIPDTTGLPGRDRPAKALNGLESWSYVLCLMAFVVAVSSAVYADLIRADRLRPGRRRLRPVGRPEVAGEVAGASS